MKTIILFLFLTVLCSCGKQQQDLNRKVDLISVVSPDFLNPDQEVIRQIDSINAQTLEIRVPCETQFLTLSQLTDLQNQSWIYTRTISKYGDEIPCDGPLDHILVYYAKLAGTQNYPWNSVNSRTAYNCGDYAISNTWSGCGGGDCFLKNGLYYDWKVEYYVTECPQCCVDLVGIKYLTNKRWSSLCCQP